MKAKLSNKLIFGIATALIVAGLAAIMPQLFFNLSNHGSVSAHSLPRPKTVAQPKAPLITGHPVSISVPSVNINIPVIDGYYNQKTRDWTLSLDKAQFATPTTPPNNLGGNTFIYGHFRWGVFYTLPKIQPGAEAIITTDNGYKFTYHFYSTYATQPTDLSVLHYQGEPILTLQTCSGSYYQNRQMYLFSYVGYQKV
jgi:LPXTG-site transpeptidase (sortase) family protein